MERKVKWRTFWLLVLVALSILALVPTVVGEENLPRWYTNLFDTQVQYGLDLQGGSQLVYTIDLNKAVDDKGGEIKRDIEAQLEELKIGGKVSTPHTPPGAVSIILDDASHVEQIRSRVQKDFDETVVMRTCPEGEAFERSICFRVSSDYAEGIKKAALEQAILTIRERIDANGIAEPSVIAKGDEIIVELPGLNPRRTDEVKELIERAAKLEFKVVHDATSDPKKHMEKLLGFVAGNKAKGIAGDPRAAELGITAEVDGWTHQESGRNYTDYYLKAEDKRQFLSHAEADKLNCKRENNVESNSEGRFCDLPGYIIMASYLEKLVETHPEFALDDEHEYGYEYVVPENKANPYWRSYYMFRAVELGGSAVKEATTYIDPTDNRPKVSVDFNRWGGRRFGEMTGAHVGQKMAIILDGKVKSAPTISQRLDQGSSSISMGGGTADTQQAEANALVTVLRAGSLPAPLRVDREAKVGASLGKDAINKAKFAFILGSLLVVIIMVLYYRVSGVLSVVALALNILFMMALLATFGATLTLPGIAAVVLTVGMAVDANIIIYERIREELRAGKSVKGAVDAGFNRGFAAIIDGQLTTGVAGYVLYQYGSGPIKGFAVMLMIGIVCTLFTATWVTRLFFEHYVGKGKKAPTLSI